MTVPKILVVTPGFGIHGGVSEFNKLLFKYSKSKLSPFFLSSAGKDQSRYLKQILFLYDVLRFVLRVTLGNYDIIHLNPSLGKNAIKRDALFTWIGKKFDKQIFIHWHGWNPENEYLLEGSSLKFLKKTLFKADHIKFLSSEFERIIVNKGYKHQTSIGNTCVDDEVTNSSGLVKNDSSRLDILFLSSVTKNKGIYIALKAFELIRIKYPDIKLIIAGTGPELQKIKDEMGNSDSGNIIFKGFVEGDKKVLTFQEASIYLFPSYYEGMPTSVIEAMGFGLPVVCSTAGAIPDFFIDGKMGFMVTDQNAEFYSDALDKLITNPALINGISEFNKNFIRTKFLASDTMARIDNDYLSLISKQVNDN